MIASFRSRPLAHFAETGDASKLPARGSAIIAKLERQLGALDVAAAPAQMNVPGWKFHRLEGKPTRFSVWVTGNYRLTFSFKGPDAQQVDLEDYH